MELEPIAIAEIPFDDANAPIAIDEAPIEDAF